MPVGNVLVGDTGGDIEHDDTALSLNVVTISETTKLLLTGSVPDIETDGAVVGGECEGVDLHTEGGWWLKESVDTGGLASQAAQWAYRCTSSQIHQ